MPAKKKNPGQPQNLKPFKKGHVPHNFGLKGKPSGKISSKTLIQYWLDMEVTDKHPNDKRRRVPESEQIKITWFDKTIIAMMKQAAAGNTFAFNALIDRLEGKPSATINHESETIKSVTFHVKKSPDEKK